MSAPQSTLPVAQRPLSQVSDVRQMLVNDQAKAQLSAVAAAHMRPERMMRLMANAIRTTPKLGQCSPISLLGAMMQCASLGLEPNTVLGHAYLIPFDKKTKDPSTGKWVVAETNVQLIIGYKGYIDLARRSGHITSISAGIHYSDDVETGGRWEYEEGTEAKLRHTPGKQAGEKLHAYAIARFRDGGHAYIVLPWSKVMKIRDGSQGWQSAQRAAKQYGKTEINSPWYTHEDEMAMKTAIRALSKYLPLSTDFRDGIESDGARADYAQFALDPTAGLAVESYEDRADEIEADAAPERLDTEPQKEPPKNSAQKSSQKETPKGDTSQSVPPDFEKFIEHVDGMISGDLQDGAPLAEVLDLYKAQMDKIKEHAPKAHQDLMDAYEAWNKG
jgi:recombination protein RecT